MSRPSGRTGARRGARPGRSGGRGSGGGRRPRIRREAPSRAPRAVLYLGGGVAIGAAGLAGALPLAHVPLAVAAVLLLVGIASREDAPWGAVLVLGLAGLGVLAAERGWVPRVEPTRDVGAAVGAGAGLVLVVLLDAYGAVVGVASTAAAVAGVAAVIAAREDVAALARPETWGALLFLLGAVNLLLWARDREVALSGPRR
ncbi:hypothetical protein [Patulibacter sp. SYSU D01012]|uniref:hypothetical protein n=1 Tax=Patulibacter sp. SYSU D01012 TaxID=2817381 RepID=UPI001B30E5BE|nr:hypothetical protein [Patulibacter sp. SYSU D01012]